LRVDTQKLRGGVVADRVEVPKQRVNTTRPVPGRAANRVPDPHDRCMSVPADELFFIHRSSLGHRLFLPRAA
jgi:hypothetical protein